MIAKWFGKLRRWLATRTQPSSAGPQECSLHGEIPAEEREALATRYAELLHDAYVIAIDQSEPAVRVILEGGAIFPKVHGFSATAAFAQILMPNGKKHVLGYTWDFIDQTPREVLAANIAAKASTALANASPPN